MSKIYLIGQYIIIEQDGGLPVRTFDKVSPYSESIDAFRLERDEGGNSFTIPFTEINSGAWIDGNEATSIPHTIETLRTFLRSNTAVVSGSGGDSTDGDSVVVTVPTESFANVGALKYFKYNQVTDKLEANRSITTTLNSFYLGDQHRISSGGDNIFFTNLTDNKHYYSAKGSVSSDGLVVERGTIRDYGAYSTLNHAEGTGTKIFREIYPATDNFSVFGFSLISGQALLAGTKLLYSIHHYKGAHSDAIDDSPAFKSNLDVKMYEQVITLASDIAIGDTIDINFSQPSDTEGGKVIYNDISILDGDRNHTGYLLAANSVTAGVFAQTLRHRVYTDRLIAAEGGEGVKVISNDIANFKEGGTYEVDTSNNTVTLSITQTTFKDSFYIGDALGTFGTNILTVDFSAWTYPANHPTKAGESVGLAKLSNNGDSYLFYYMESKGMWYAKNQLSYDKSIEV